MPIQRAWTTCGLDAGLPFVTLDQAFDTQMDHMDPPFGIPTPWGPRPGHSGLLHCSSQCWGRHP
eukprot:5474086-Alexandrium_andersonii.AAC.1